MAMFLDARFSEALGSAMLGKANPAEVKEAIAAMEAQTTATVGSEMCWPVDWFPEHLPIESATGNSIWLHLQHHADPHSCISQWPPVDRGPVTKEDVLVFADSFGFCKEILEQAPPGRLGLTNVQTKAASAQSEKDVRNLVKMHPWDVIIFALGVDPPEKNDIDEIHRQQIAVIKVLLTIFKCLADDASRCKRLVVLTSDCFAEETEIHEEMGLGLITHCTLFGMCNCARLEMPVPIQYIDAEWALRTENIKYLASEIFRHSSFGHNTVRILNRGRYVLRQVPSKPYENLPDFQVPDDGVIGISGGNGALGIVMGQFLLAKAKEQGGKRFSMKFLSRSARVTDDNLANWEDVQRLAAELGIGVEQAKCDCGSRESVDAFVKEHTPNLRGFIHSAGVLRDGMLMNLTMESYDEVFQPKSRAALFLHNALEENKNPWLEFFWLFSSIAVYGSMGQGNYSASNAYLDGLCRHRKALGLPAQAPQWGPWGEVGMASRLDPVMKARMAAQAIPPFSSADGLRGLECLLRSGMPQAQVTQFNPAAVAQTLIAGDRTPTECYVQNFWAICQPSRPGDPNKNPYSTLSYTKRAQNLQYQKGLGFIYYHGDVAEYLQEEEE